MSPVEKLFDQTLEQIETVRYGGFTPKSMMGYSRQRLEWLWPNMIGKGLLHVFAGDSGIGKTLLLCDIAAIVSRGGIFPAETTQCPRGKVIYLSGEDSINHTLGPRLEASGADLANMMEWPTATSSGSQFDLATDLGSIEEFIEDDGEVAMLIIDPVTSFCGGRFDNDSVTSVRHITTKLNNLAESTGVAIIALQHLTKSENPKIKNRILGSGAWVHGPRIVLAAIHTDDDYRLFGKIKANVTDTYGVYPFNIESRDIPDIEGVRRIEWSDEAWHNNQLSEFEDISRPTDRKSDLALEILRQSLEDGGWRSRGFLMQKIRAAVDVSESTVKRLSKELGVEKRRTSDVPAQTEWRLTK
tara:strand:- start:851 stop:1921 length:1071 start_codon:yes stop_codon:yes gene_type:complete